MGFFLWVQAPHVASRPKSAAWVVYFVALLYTQSKSVKLPKMEIDRLELKKAEAAIELGGAELARRTGYPENRWSEVLSGKRWPMEASLEKAADALGIDADYLAIAIRVKRILNKMVDTQGKGKLS